MSCKNFCAVAPDFAEEEEEGEGEGEEEGEEEEIPPTDPEGEEEGLDPTWFERLIVNSWCWYPPTTSWTLIPEATKERKRDKSPTCPR